MWQNRGGLVAVPFGRSGIERQQGFRCCFSRRRLALATARACHGETGEASDALPALDTKRDADSAAASDFSLTIRRYSAGERSFWFISRVRRTIVSHDASISSVSIIGTG